MKKILSLFTMLLVTLTAMAAIEPVEVVTPGYQPDGATFGNDKQYTIDWDKQYVKAVIDVSTCTGTSENILSVGEDLDNWFIGGWHFYYSVNHASYGAHALKVDYLDTSDNGKGHPLLTYKTDITGTITVEISKEHGVLVNGEEYNSFNGTQTGTWQELTAALWSASTIQIGSAEGSNRSHATYTSVEILPIETEEPITVVSDTTYTDSLSTSIVANEGEPVILKAADKQLLVEKMSDDTYRFTFKDLCIDGHALGDVTVSDVQLYTDEDGDFYSLEEDGKTVTLTTDDETFNGATLTIDLFNAAPMTAENGKTYFAAYMELSGTVGTDAYELAASFGSEPKDEDTTDKEVIIAEDYEADGSGFLFTTPIDWDKYKVQAIVDVTNCQRTTEDLFSVGTDATSWEGNIHVYRKSSGVFTSFWDGGDGMGNNNTGEYTVDSNPVTIEISKADGLVVDGTVKIAASRMSGLYALTEIAIGSGEGDKQQSYATYKSIKLVPLATTPDPETNDTVAYAGQMAYTFNMYGDETKVTDRSATVELVKKTDGTYAFVIKDLRDADGDTMGDFSFDVNVEEVDGTTYITATEVSAPLPGDWAAYNGTVTMTGTSTGEGQLTADFTMNYGGFYTATMKFGDSATAINDATTDRTVTGIYTVGGAKTQSLQKGVNIVRMANGKTVKVLK